MRSARLASGDVAVDRDRVERERRHGGLPLLVEEVVGGGGHHQVVAPRRRDGSDHQSGVDVAVVVRGEDDRRRVVEAGEVVEAVDAEDLGVGDHPGQRTDGPSMMTPRATRATGPRAHSVS
jgi:hypothetical protein